MKAISKSDEKFEKMAKDIFHQFDWEKVHRVMKLTDWNWAMGVDEDGMTQMGIPSIETIQNQAYRMLKRSYECKGHSCTGGLSAGWESGHMYLIFTLEEVTSD